MTGQETGRARGLVSCATLADGSQITTPRLLRLAARRLKRAQRRVARRQKGSHRLRQAVRLLARAHQPVRRARTDFQPKVALALVRQDDTLYQEDLQTAHLRRNHHLAKRSAAAGWRAFLSLLACKAASAGKRVVAVPPAYPRPTCSGWGVLVQTGLSVRWPTCPDGGASLHRDHNAAKTSERFGQTLRGAVA